jgi:hypothetical protein
MMAPFEFLYGPVIMSLSGIGKDRVLVGPEEIQEMEYQIDADPRPFQDS